MNNLRSNINCTTKCNRILKDLATERKDEGKDGLNEKILVTSIVFK